MGKVRKAMSTKVRKVKSSATILEAASVMNDEKSSGAAVVDGEKVVQEERVEIVRELMRQLF